MSTLAHRYPDYIRNMITDHGDGTYSVRLYSYEREAWQDITVDNRLPVQNGDLVMCSMTAQCAIWPCILQKAGAMYTGSYRCSVLI